MQVASRIATNTAALYIRMIVTVFVSLYSTRLILEALGSVDFGIFNLIAAVISMLSFLNASMTAATQRFMSHAEGIGDKERLNKIFNVSILLHIVVAVIMFFLLDVAGEYIFNEFINIPDLRIGTAKIVFQFALVTAIINIISVPYEAVINAHENMMFYALIGILEVLSKFIIALLIYFISGDKLIFFGLMTVVLSFVFFVIRCLYCHFKYNECRVNILKYFNMSIFKEMCVFAGWSLLGSSSSMLSNYSQGIVINVFFGPALNASQGIATQISGQLGAFSSNMLKAINPVIDKSEGAGKRELMIKVSNMGSKVSFFLLMFFYIPFLLETPYLLKLWLKLPPDYSVIFCRLLLVRNLIEQCFYTLYSSINAVGNIRKYQLVSSILVFTPLLGSILLFNISFPPYAIYILFIAYSVINSVLILSFSRVLINLNVLDFVRNIIGRCSATFLFVMVFCLIPLFTIVDDIIRLIAIIVTNFFLFFVGVYLIGFSSNEKVLILQVLQSLVDRSKTKFKALDISLGR